MTGNVFGGVVAAALGGPLSDSLSELARLIGDWAFRDAALRTSQPAGRIAQIADESPRTLTRHDTWLDPQLLVPEERPERGVRVKAPTPPADPGRGRFTDLLGGQPQLTGPTNFGPFPSFVGVRAAPVFVSDPPPSPRNVANGIGAPIVEQSSQTMPFGVRTAVNADELDEPIPNEAPIAVDDTVTVDEDGSVVFDPTANDVDLDYDALWVKSVQAETQYGRTYWEEGGSIRYIPNPDYENTSGQSYYEPDSFTYTVTDGLAEATATVTVTVNAVDDPVVAFDDAYYMGPTGMPVGVEDGLLRNDIDYDIGAGYGSGLRVVNVDASGIPEGVNLLIDSDDGSFSLGYDEGGDVRQKASFTYQATDGKTLSSQATVHLWLDPLMDGPAPAPTVTAGVDKYFVGDDILQSPGSVMDNDSNGVIAVLRSHPAGGRVTAFSTDGHFEYMPSFSGAGPSFEYAVFGSEGWNAAEATVELSKIDLTIYHGQNGKAVSELNERVENSGGTSTNPYIPVFKGTGAFTVANLNDSDVDGTPDHQDNDVPTNPNFARSGEVDLMKLVMSKPAAVANQPNVTLTVASSTTPGVVPAVKLWKVATKGNQPQPIDAKTGMASIPVNAIPAELWVEFTGPSLVLGDVSITMQYAGAKDTVSATGIWTKYEQKAPYWPAGYFMNTGTALPNDCDAKGIRRLFDTRGKTLGLTPNVPIQGKANWFNTRNNALQKFTVLPSGMTNPSVLGIVSFDATRSVETGGTYIVDPGGTKPLTRSRPPWLDTATDESLTGNDVDSDLSYINQQGKPTSTDNIYYWDAPGIPPWESKATGVYRETGEKVIDYVFRGNFYDFIRIAFSDEPWNQGQFGGTQGSRSSVYYFWSSMLHAHEQLVPAENWYMTRIDDAGTVTENRIEKGLININVAGGGVT